MTLTQKETITAMRGVGDSYAKIAAALCVSENTVKSYCQRNKLGGGFGGGPGAKGSKAPHGANVSNGSNSQNVSNGLNDSHISKRSKALDFANDPSRCKQCGAKLKQAKGKKTRKFCSPPCCSAWWNSHPEAVTQKAVYSFTCPNCGKAFTSYGNAKRKYCTHDCYISARFKNTESKNSENGAKDGERV